MNPDIKMRLHKRMADKRMAEYRLREQEITPEQIALYLQHCSVKGANDKFAREMLSFMEPMLRERYLKALSTQRSDYLYDPIQDDPALKDAFEFAGAEARHLAKAGGLEGKLGTCHFMWDVQRRVLREKYGITWFSPKQMNPGVRYD